MTKHKILDIGDYKYNRNIVPEDTRNTVPEDTRNTRNTSIIESSLYLNIIDGSLKATNLVANTEDISLNLDNIGNIGNIPGNLSQVPIVGGNVDCKGCAECIGGCIACTSTIGPSIVAGAVVIASSPFLISGAILVIGVGTCIGLGYGIYRFGKFVKNTCTNTNTK